MSCRPHRHALFGMLMVSLLKWPCEADTPLAHGQDRLLDLIAEEPPPEAPSVQEWIGECVANGRMWSVPLGMVLGVVDNCCEPFPKAAFTAAALMSLAVSRRPAAALWLLDPVIATCEYSHPSNRHSFSSS